MDPTVIVYICFSVMLVLLVTVFVRLLLTNRQLRRITNLIRRDSDRAAHESSDIFRTLAASHEQVSSLSEHVDRSIESMRRENDERFDYIESLVTEKLDDRLNGSFRMVSDRLSKLSGELGELKSIGGSVEELRRMMTGTNSRGAWGEFRLGGLIRQILSSSQYLENTPIDPASSARVEFAVKIPSGDSVFLLPIDSKFPQADYLRLLNSAQTDQSPEAFAKARTFLERTVKECAKQIRDKYIRPPYSTDFAVMFLPTEGLFSEVLQIPGLQEELQAKYSVCVAGPSTLSALLISLETGFRSYNIEKKSGEVIRAVSAIKDDLEHVISANDAVTSRIRQTQEAEDQLDKALRKLSRTLAGIDIGEDN